jgi:hypothetical protein
MADTCLAPQVDVDADHRLLLHYSPSAISPTLALLAEGQDPVVTAWKEVISEDHGEQVIFGYGVVKSKGVVLLFLSDSVG